jgi:hypothetical protein
MSFQKNNPEVFDQHLWDISSTAKHQLGTVRELADGRTFVYAQAGAVDLVEGTLNQMAVQVANHLNMDIAAAPTAASGAIGSFFATPTLGATAATAGQYSEGYLYHNKNGVLGQMYKIKGHPAADASTALKIELFDPIRVALADADEVTIAKHPQDGVIIYPTTSTRVATGVAPVAVTAAYYFWNQVKGPAAVLADGTLVLGNHVRASDGTAGAVENLDRDGVAEDDVCVGTCINIGTTAETAFIMLAIPGY